MENYRSRNPLAPDNRLRFFLLTDRAFSRHLSIVGAELGLDPIDVVIGFAILLGGVEHMEQPGGEGWRYAALDTPPPQDARRSVNVSSLARSLGIPRETVRRRSELLIRKRIAQRVDDGLKAESGIGGSLEHRQALLLAQLKPLADLLSEIGYRPSTNLPNSRPRLNFEEAVRRVRQFSRILLRLQLRHYSIVVRLGGDLQRGLILTRLIDLSGVVDGSNPFARPGPTSRTAISEAINLNRESTRRHLIRLEAEGAVGKTADGYLPSQLLLSSHALETALKETAANLRQQVRLLAAFGFIHEPSPYAGIPASLPLSAAPVGVAPQGARNGRPEDCAASAGPAQGGVARLTAWRHQGDRSKSHPPLRSPSPTPEHDPDFQSDGLGTYIAAQLALREMMQAFRALAGVDPLDAIITATVAMASVAHLDRPGGDGDRYASFDRTPPPGARKPISVSAVARSLSLPRETVRRRARSLSEAGWLQVSAEGLGSVPAFMDVTGHQLFLARVNLAGLTFLRALGRRSPGADAERGSPIDVAAVAGRDRLFARLCLQFALGLYEAATALTGDLERSLALTTLIAMAFEATSVPGPARKDHAPTSSSRPVTRLSMAARLDIHPETLRRLLLRLEADGQINRTGSGYAPSSSLLEGAALGRSIELTLVQTRNFIRSLGRAGFLTPPDAGPVRAPG